MNQKKFAQETELGNGNIGGSGSLKTLDTANADTNMRCLDHRHVIGTIANGQEQRLEMPFDKLDNQRFLEGGNTTNQS